MILCRSFIFNRGGIHAREGSQGHDYRAAAEVVLEELSRSRRESQMISQRARIILRAFERVSNEEISLEVGLERKQVGLWRRCWQQAWEQLILLECTQPRRLRDAIRETLRDAPRSGTPGIFTAGQIAQILAVACEDPALSERPITHWTQRELREEVLKRGIVESISVSRIGHFLREAADATSSPEDVAEHEGERLRSVRATGPDRVRHVSGRAGSL